MRCKKGRTKTLRRCLKAAAVRKAEQTILSRRNAEERVYPSATVPLASSCGGTGGALPLSQFVVAKTTLLVFLLTCYVITLEVLAQFFLLCILVTRCHTVL